MNQPIRLAAFTLTELLIALVIVGILVYLALPDFGQVVTNAKTTEAKLQLEHLHQLQTAHFYERSTYAQDLSSIGFQQQKLVTDGGPANYRIEIATASNSAYLAKAVSVSDFDQDGVFNVWEIDNEKNLKETIPD